MSILRTRKQAAFNDLLVALEDSVNRYADLAALPEDSALAPAFNAFLRERTTALESLRIEMRRLHDLPSEPNPDRTDMGKLVHRIRASLSSHEARHALNEMLAAEQRTLELAQACAGEEPDAVERKLLDDITRQVEHAIAELARMAAVVA